ncbi:hypothetical protein [Caulobacter sp. 17J80-11]|uniref:hypothetical protein n=1 Tax=Caulobacter sp. 17J80-11 TaxID=2763502 RepID=UPI0016535534|nr:hypothetical protein [Caulobacter sp. 17J80-11]MBC6981866.1 hypothetical protein [Caulobacter sp. 17J80-11]
MRIASSILVAAALLAASPALAVPPARSDQIKQDDDPYIAGPSTPERTLQPREPALEQTTPSQTRQFVAQTDDQGRVISNAPIPDTQANRQRYGQPLSNAGRRSPAKGN